MKNPILDLDMELPKQVVFTLRAKVNGKEITPATIGFSLFNQFNTEVEEFLIGSQRRLPLDEVHAEIEDGSYKLRLLLPVLLAATVEPDLHKLQKENSLGDVDPKRAAVVERWQKRARQNPDYLVGVESLERAFPPIKISNDTDYHTPDEDDWVAVEKYVVGTVVDMGGTTAANVHLLNEDTGKRLVATSSEDFLRDQRENYLYRKVQIHVAAQENVKTGELRDVRLISFIGKGPSYDEAELEAAIAKGTKAWAKVPDSVAWLKEIRGVENE
ncbi:MAG TPA: hypothetical protein VFV23_14595 [Verrucomicrobiae bacterium]|nr:hypothetical protein [Verrucomicrobiae bacterium]